MSKFLFPLIIFVLAAFFIYRTWTNHKVADENFSKGQEFLLENSKKEGVITTESGLQYLVLEKVLVTFTQLQIANQPITAT